MRRVAKTTPIFLTALVLTGCTQGDQDSLKMMFSGLGPQWQASGIGYSDAEAYSQAGIPPFMAEQWKSADFTAGEAIQWRNAGYNPEQAKKLRQSGALSASQVTKLASALRINPNPSDYDASMLAPYFSAISTQEVTNDDIAAVMETGAYNASEFGFVLQAAKLVRAGSTGEEAVGVINKKISEVKHAQVVSEYGSDILKACNGVPEYLPAMRLAADPYQAQGHCYQFTLGFAQDTFQWIDGNTLLLTSVPMLIRGETHILIGHRMVAIGLAPAQYQSVAGATQTPITLSVLKYLN